ncbi:MAG TPA: hypothetical protein VD928_01945 [Candidatus Paceibacterota bacterium]|nr:hypothetical protein [Candidatus Paceibacterota bacterium]
MTSDNSHWPMLRPMSEQKHSKEESKEKDRERKYDPHDNLKRTFDVMPPARPPQPKRSTK